MSGFFTMFGCITITYWRLSFEMLASGEGYFYRFEEAAIKECFFAPELPEERFRCLVV